mmetsp:Transcript_33611/g.77550  ORF Transcript_33611/g.77550 Transcript_33611/m.77550 type:complete len:149 (-) Transcript_33611:373-819(-)|eukprot:CAMPEP_0113307588 /NCGR_PEP_ID=MMETSP0010_2-20120614/6374_1 /TAXON_ID=216773 ORGANISM="Corethron hystrix, Strain 308" /NCGR_SAMPLE_ID=MMETSP0010_2 /ASSEMBLY_ACC=CAM_ASM_000155 /LENGTH=148 /DNA_ID=CAMNT_0000162475 /DNA_START=155 /DNA_END=601 /DNA_ORIENTATION=+ /assembly_acc=CAM_ASM_000155
MVKAPDALVWQIVGNNNCFLQKRNGHTKRSGAINFSSEVGNLKSLSSFRYSGLANSRACDVTATEDNAAVLTMRAESKVGSKPSAASVEIPLNRCFRRSAKTIGNTAGSPYYRPDLQKAALAKYDKIYRANRIAKGVKKPVLTKKGRS